MGRNDLFERIKERVGIVGYVEAETGFKAKKIGSTYRINPCPLPGCGHNDCFTLYPDDNSFHCFSCERAGDVICFERLHQNLPDNFEAAKSIAKKRTIPINEHNSAEQSKGTLKNPKKGSPKTDGGVDPSRVGALWEIVADFYHDQLLKNQEALEYQTGERAHSMEILRKLKVGYSGKDSLIKHVRSHGYIVKDLIAIGLVRGFGKGYRAIISKGMYVYPHRIDGRVVYLTLKDPHKKKAFQIKKQYAGKGWLCLNQDVLKEDGPIIITEGENDLLSLIDKARQSNVICTIGNFNTSNILNHLKKVAQGRVFYLCFDRDEAGHNYKKKYSEAILAGGGQVWVIDIPEPHKDIDEFLRASKDPKADFASLMDAARAIEKGTISDATQGDGTGPLISGFSSFKILGELADGRLAFWSRVKRKIYLTTLKDFNLDALDQIGGEEIRHKVVRSKGELQDGKVHFFALKRDIIVEAGKTLLGEEKWIGQGVNLLQDGQLLIVNGDQAAIWDGKRFAVYEDPMIEQKFIKRSPADQWIDLGILQKKVLKMNKAEARQVLLDALHLIQQWGFISDYDEALVAGFLFAQMVQAIWRWRPHMWISGPQGSGKTLLIELFDRIAGKLSRRYEGQTLTEAGFRQDLKHDFCLSQIDEFEKSDARQELLDLLRSAGRGGSSTKGTPSGKAIHHSIRHMVLIASIERGLARAAEKHRFIVVEMRKDPTRSPRILSPEKANQIRMNFFAFALWASFRAKKMIGDLDCPGKFEPRLVEAYAVPLSMICVIDPDPLKSLQKYTFEILESRKEYGEGDIPEDEVALFEDILTSTIRVPIIEDGGHTHYAERAIRQLLKVRTESNEAILQALGIKICQDGLFVVPQVIERKLLRDTIWRGLNIRSILKRLPGAVIKKRRMSGEPTHGLLLTEHTQWGNGTMEQLGTENGTA